jgi:NADH-quinone oxidoreductase subunit E
MAKASDKTGGGQPAEPVDLSHVADVLKDMPNVPLHPLMAHPAAAFAAATAIGFGMATHMTSVILGSLQGAIEASGKLARRLEEEQAAAAGNGATSEPAEPAAAVAVTAEKPRKAAAPRKVAPKAVNAAPVVAKPAAEKTKKAAAKADAPAKAAPAPAKEAKAAKPARATSKVDDLKKIEGIGPKLEQVLNGRGIRRFADLAALDATALAALDEAIGLGGRAIRDDWAGQARALAGARK